MELIRIITTGGQGSPVVSARELHSFLEVKSKFSDWFRNRVTLFAFVEGHEYVTLPNSAEEGFSKTLEKVGRPELDYGLTLDTAKELSMVERTPKGKQARQYFIEAEKQLRQQQDPIMQRLAVHEQRIAVLEQQVATLLDRQHSLDENIIIAVATPTTSLRTKVYKLVNDYAKASLTAHYMVWNEVYNRLQNLYGFNVRAHKKFSGESWIDVADRHNQMERIYAIVQAELNYSEE